MKHVGKTDGKKVVVLFRQVPSEDHMCLICFPETLPRLYHDSIMKCLESPVGQNAENFGEPLGRELMADGRGTLQAMHQEGFIRKIQTNFIIMTPAAGSTIKLDELNKILTEMAQGADAVERLSKLDKQAGMYHPDNHVSEVVSVQEDILTDESLAQDQLNQAARMEADAKNLINEAKNLTAEAYKMAPALKPKVKRAAKKTAVVKKTPAKKVSTKKQQA